MKTLIFGVLLFIGFGFSADGQTEIALELCKDCESHLIRFLDDKRISCLESEGHPIIMGPGFYAGLKLNENPSIEAMQKELRKVSSTYFKVDLSEIEVLRIENQPRPNGYLVYCRNKGLEGIIGVNVIDVGQKADENRLRDF